MSSQELLDEYTRHKAIMDRTVRKIVDSVDPSTKSANARAKGRARYAQNKLNPEWVEANRAKNKALYQQRKLQKALLETEPVPDNQAVKQPKARRTKKMLQEEPESESGSESESESGSGSESV